MCMLLMLIAHLKFLCIAAEEVPSASASTSHLVVETPRTKTKGEYQSWEHKCLCCVSIIARSYRTIVAQDVDVN